MTDRRNRRRESESAAAVLREILEETRDARKRKALKLAVDILEARAFDAMEQG